MSLFPLVLADEEIERAAERYLELPAAERRTLSFERFLARWAADSAAAGRRLVEQLALRARLDELDRKVGCLGQRQRYAVAALERDGAACANGRFVEKLKHRRWPKSRRNFFPES